jgi:plastocyanin domain-containing protein
MKTVFLTSLLLVILALVGVIVLLSKNGKGSAPVASGQSNVALVDGAQVIQIRAKGGYAPRSTNAKANVPTTLNITTSGTFDCSSAIAIPSLGYRTNLPPSGVTTVTIPPQPAGTTMQGLCAMGMYNFTLNFN